MRGPKVTLEQWRTLMAVVDFGGYAQAAEALHKSQSSISYTVTKLQEQLGMVLLHIEGRKAVLTPAGQALLQRSRHLLDHAVELEQVASSLQQGWEPQVALAMDVIFPKDSLVQAFKAFLPQSQGCKLMLQEEVLSGAAEALLEQKADLSITPVVPPGFMGEKLMDIPFIAVASPDHELHTSGKLLSLDDLSKHMHIVIKDTGLKRNLDSGWLGSDLRWTLSTFESAKTLLLNGLGFSWLPIHYVQQEINDGTLKPLKFEVSYEKQGTLYLVYANKDIAGSATQLLAQCIKDSSALYARQCAKLL